MIRRTDPRQHQSFTEPDLPRDVPAHAESLVFHCTIAMFGGGFCAAFACALLVRATGIDPTVSNSNLLMWYSPLIWWPGLLLGFALNRRAHSSTACFTWLSGALVLGFLAIDIFWATHSWRHTMADVFPLSRLEYSPEDTLGFMQLFFVWPAMNSFAYAIGASIPLLLGGSTQQNHSSRAHTR